MGMWGLCRGRCAGKLRDVGCLAEGIVLCSPPLLRALCLGQLELVLHRVMLITPDPHQATPYGAPPRLVLVWRQEINQHAVVLVPKLVCCHWPVIVLDHHPAPSRRRGWRMPNLHQLPVEVKRVFCVLLHQRRRRSLDLFRV